MTSYLLRNELFYEKKASYRVFLSSSYLLHLKQWFCKSELILEQHCPAHSSLEWHFNCGKWLFSECLKNRTFLDKIINFQFNSDFSAKKLKRAVKRWPSILVVRMIFDWIFKNILHFTYVF